MEIADLSGIGGMSETVCLSHITDLVLQSRLESEVNDTKCSFCGREAVEGEAPFALPMDALGVYVWEAATWLYSEAWNIEYYDGEPWSDEELWDTSDVIYDTVEDALDVAYSEKIIERLKAATTSSDDWTSREHASDVDLGWFTFAKTIRNESRFILIGDSKRVGFENEPPARLARFLEALLDYVESDLLITLDAGSVLYRGRMTDDARRLRDEVKVEPSTKLGSAPAQFAEAGRLSPKGIGLFYAADNLEVAVREIALHSPYNEALMGGFETKRDFKVLDFSRELKKLPSIFASDPVSRRRWTFARFVKHFTSQISAPVVLDGRQLIDYTPTQMVAEYFRFVPVTRIDGIAWPSHLAKDGEGRNIMLFFGAGPDFQTVPPTPAELSREGGAKDPALTLSVDDLTEHRVGRSVKVVTL
ncbi:RES domain-containing protein [Clavibacter zhangzhiyongii]|uniref:RES domain-containing protein n=1 Tax=Clavibacter TaxID=1573 RepID=UPI0039E09F46